MIPIFFIFYKLSSMILKFMVFLHGCAVTRILSLKVAYIVFVCDIPALFVFVRSACTCVYKDVIVYGVWY